MPKLNPVKYSTMQPQKVIDFLKAESDNTGISIWRLIYNALIEKYPKLK